MITFYKLWDYMNRNHIKKKDLRDILSPTTISKLSKNEVINTDTIDKIIEFLNNHENTDGNCHLEDICEYEKNATENTSN